MRPAAGMRAACHLYTCGGTGDLRLRGHGHGPRWTRRRCAARMPEKTRGGLSGSGSAGTALQHHLRGHVGNPHCVVFCPRVDEVNVEQLGPRFENAPYFPRRINTEFVRVVNPGTIKMRVWERGSGETMACGTGACAAVAAATANGLCEKGRDVTVRAKGGDLIVNYTDQRVTLTGDAKLVYMGELEY